MLQFRAPIEEAAAPADLPAHPLADLFPLIEGEEFEALVWDISEHGVREPIVLYEGAILDGRNRYRAARQANVSCRFEIYDGNDPAGYVVSLNLRRRHLNESQRAMVAAKLANMREGRPRETAQICAVSQDRAADMLNVSRRSVQTAADVRDRAVPELQRQVERGTVSVSAAADVATLSAEEQREIVARGEKDILEKAKQIRAKKAEEGHKRRIAKIVEISRGNVALGTEQKYPVIYADPPWRYERRPMGKTDRSIENHYPTMTVEEICALPVRDLAPADAILYLWATAPNALRPPLAVLEAWGFEYCTQFVWVKDKIGMGHHDRNQHELLYVATRGNIPPPLPGDRVSSVIYSKRGLHSEKPIEAVEMIESFYPDLPKIELFCRDPRPGWVAWGNQVGAKRSGAA